MVKKKRQTESCGEEVLPGQRSADYTVGQVSGSLFSRSPAASGSLSALFTVPAATPSLRFQSPAEPVQKKTEAKEEQKKAPEVKGQPGQKKTHKPKKEKSAAEQQVENRESSLLKADEDERGQQKAGRKRKREEEEEGREKGAEHWVMKRQKQRAWKEEEALKRKKTVFVGNLPISCTKKTLRTIFKDKGVIDSIRFRSVVREDPSMSRKVATITRKVHPKKQSMNAYVVFKDEDGAARALERNGMEVEKDFYIRVDRVGDASSHDHRRSVFVGNLSFEIKEVSFRRHFEECGAVEAVRLVRDKSSGLGKGFGYVLFESGDSVQLALKLDGSKLEGRALRVKRSVKKEKQKNQKDARGTQRTDRGPNRGSSSKGPMKGPSKGPMKGPSKGPMKGPSKGPMKGHSKGQENRAGRGGFKSPKKFRGKEQTSSKSPSSFKGEMADSTKKTKKKGLKKKGKPKKSVHI